MIVFWFACPFLLTIIVNQDYSHFHFYWTQLVGGAVYVYFVAAYYFLVVRPQTSAVFVCSQSRSSHRHLDEKDKTKRIFPTEPTTPHAVIIRQRRLHDDEKFGPATSNTGGSSTKHDGDWHKQQQQKQKQKQKQHDQHKKQHEEVDRKWVLVPKRPNRSMTVQALRWIY